MKLDQAIKFMRGHAPHMPPALFEREVTSFVIDSRSSDAGGVFFALSQPEYAANGFNGDFADSTEFAAAALDGGSAAVVLRRDRYAEHIDSLGEFQNRLIFVDDVIAALQSLAHGVYLDWNRPVVAITGSAGKTTAKELTAHVLSSGGHKVLCNIKNFNNGLGHPLTVLRLAKDNGYDTAVLEMGMSTPLNEIARLCRITPPDVAVVLNVLPVHIEHLGSIENIAKAKAEIVEGMKPSGTAVLNADDPRVAQMAASSRGNTLTFGLESPADVRAEDVVSMGFAGTRFTLVTPTGSAGVRLKLSGTHSILNALAASAVGSRFGMGADEIALALSTASPPPQRGEILRFADGFTVLNDSYNSNPAALLSVAKTLKEAAAGGQRTIAVVGEMLELGPDSSSLHFETGQQLAALGLDVIIGVRGDAEHLIDGAASAGSPNATFSIDSAAAAKTVSTMIRAGDAVLVKGSRGVRTEKVIEELLNKYALEETGAVP